MGACISLASAHALDQWMHIDVSSPEFAAARAGRFTLVLFNRGRPLASQSIDLAREPHILARYQEAHDHLAAWHVDVPDIETFRLFIAGDKFFADRHRTPQQHLSEGWARHLNSLLENLSDACEDVRDFGLPPDPPPVFRRFVDAARQGDPAQLLSFFASLPPNSPELLALLKDVWAFDAYAASPSTGVGDLLEHAAQAYFAGPQLTERGRSLAWFDPESASVRQMRLAPEKMPVPADVSSWWSQIRDHMPYRHAGRILTGADQPIDDSPDGPVADLTRFPTVSDVAEARAAARALLSVSVANKQWTIPPGAVLEMPFGPFSNVQAWEFSDSCIFVCRTSDGRFATVEVRPGDGSVLHSFPLYVGSDDPGTEETPGEDDRVGAALDLLFAALVHDFFVVEEREAVFESRPQRRAPRGVLAPPTGPIVVYLPRRKYLRRPAVQRCTEALALAQRRPHAVGPHLRRSTSFTDRQRSLAIRYGFSVPEGYTFVRPHERGTGKRDVVYRSRSATWLLYEVEEPKVVYAPSDWFVFERDVRRVIQGLGFDVEHVSAGRRGDDGVDLFATKGAGLDEIAWVVQCKCFDATRKVSVGIVRELVGALSQYPRGTRGMIVTTSSFSRDAAQLAQTERIELIDGAEFERLRGQT